jgi:hypothetical protein
MKQQKELTNFQKQKKICRRKKPYESEEAAQFFAQADGLAPYHCPMCKLWHLTSNGKQLHRFYGPTG